MVIARSTSNDSLPTLVMPLVYLLAYLLSLKFDVGYFKIILGALLWGYWPGYYLNKVLKLNDILPAAALKIFNIVSSIAVVNLSFIFFKSYINHSRDQQIATVILTNIVIYLIYIILVKNKQSNQIEKLSNLDIILVILPLILFVIRVFLNPYISDQDGFGMINVMKSIENIHVDNSYLSARRYGFTYIVMSLHYMTGIDFLSLFKLILPGLSWIILSLPTTLLLSKKPFNIFRLTYLYLILASPAFIGHIDRFKPESITYLFGFSSALLFGLSALYNRPVLYLIGLLYSYVSFRSHDTGALWLLSYLAGSSVLITQNWAVIKPKINIKNFLIILFIALPYISVFNISGIFRYMGQSLSFFPHSISDFNPTWWFIDNYQSGGAELGWPGMTFILFYIFNGSILFPIALWVTFKLKSKVIPLTLPTIISLLVYLIISEGLPRLGYFFLPDRAWVQVFFNSATLLILLTYFNNRMKLGRFTQLLLAIAVIGSISTSIILSSKANTLVSSKEKRGLSYLKSLPRQAIILSTQMNNREMVELYGDHIFISAKFSEKESQEFSKSDKPDKLVEIVNRKIDSNEIMRNVTAGPVIIKVLIEEITKISDAGLQTTTSKNIINREVTSLEHSDLTISQKDNIYLIYSFAKTDGIMAKVGRDYWLDGLDMNNLKFFQSLKPNDVEYKDDSLVIIKIR